MKTINAVLIQDVLTPAEPLPTDAVKIVFNGEQYVIYELGDELPDFEDE
jgi:hypothetical protein